MTELTPKQVLENWKRAHQQDCSQDELYYAQKAYVESCEEMIESLKQSIVEAINILDSDLYVSRAHNCREVLEAALDENGYPDEHGPTE